MGELTKAIQYIREFGGNPDEMLILVGGTISHDDFPKLKEAGVDGIFILGTPILEIINIKDKLPEKRKMK